LDFLAQEAIKLERGFLRANQVLTIAMVFDSSFADTINHKL
jgi:hypothetical protein